MMILACKPPRGRSPKPSSRTTYVLIAAEKVLAVFDKMRVEDEQVRDWFRPVLASQTRDAQAASMARGSELQRQETLLVQQQDRLLNLRLADDIDQETFAHEGTEIRRKPFGENAEGLLSEKSRRDKTAMELFWRDSGAGRQG
jgi:hypothetical protein